VAEVSTGAFSFVCVVLPVLREPTRERKAISKHIFYCDVSDAATSVPTKVIGGADWGIFDARLDIASTRGPASFASPRKDEAPNGEHGGSGPR
jgi:hypothetical protein